MQCFATKLWEVVALVFKSWKYLNKSMLQSTEIVPARDFDYLSHRAWLHDAYTHRYTAFIFMWHMDCFYTLVLNIIDLKPPSATDADIHLITATETMKQNTRSWFRRFITFGTICSWYYTLQCRHFPDQRKVDNLSNICNRQFRNIVMDNKV